MEPLFLIPAPHFVRRHPSLRHVVQSSERHDDDLDTFLPYEERRATLAAEATEEGIAALGLAVFPGTDDSCRILGLLNLL